FTQPANLLVMDEPTNDLDAETLELLEDLLLNYSGTLLLVSHDRAFLNNVVTSSIVFDPDGGLREYVGGYEDWQRQWQQTQKQSEPKAVKAQTADTKPAQKKKSKLTYQEQLDLKALPAKIEELENRQQAFNDQMSDPAFYQQDADKITQVQQQVAALEAELDTAFERWETLEAKQQAE
ncbi:MAG: ABC transporter ATP-binding protein, partial [Pseudomonadota bacterium]|nr:ABC transporter ATP-binding protein [Pseudomonadota bacterium]